MQAEDILYLWPGEAPFSQNCAEQAQPSVKAFPVSGSRGAVVVCPGGAYTHKVPHEGDPIARMLNSEGISAFVLDYRVMPCPTEAPLTDALRAIRLVRSLGYQKVGILGFSAGGHLSSTAATLWTDGNEASADPVERFSSRPDAFIPCYGVASMREISGKQCGSIRLLGISAGDEALLHRFSPIENVNETTPPAFIWHTANDPVVPVRHSLELAAALAEHHCQVELFVSPDGRHGLGLAAENALTAEWCNACCRFLLEMGFGV